MFSGFVSFKVLVERRIQSNTTFIKKYLFDYLIDLLLTDINFDFIQAFNTNFNMCVKAIITILICVYI
jgi:hypothetical protein